ncbi:MAG: class I SAM-dependent methyltransferase [Planctomycetota bacterium]|jgi:predicted nicotinamide N-methyase
MSSFVSNSKFRGYAVRREIWELKGSGFDLTWPAEVDGLLDLPSTQKRFEEDEYMPYWGQPWPAGVMLAEAILDGESGLGRWAVEIGCGIGLVSVAAARMGWSVTAGDYDDDALAFTELNAERNRVRLVGCKRIDYRRLLEGAAYDCVLGADLTYEQRACEPVARWIASALKPQGLALISDPNRSAAESFVGHATECGLVVEVEPVQSKMPDGKLCSGRIWRLSHQ